MNGAAGIIHTWIGNTLGEIYKKELGGWRIRKYIMKRKRNHQSSK